MKKLLTILAAFGLTASASTSVVACGDKDSESEKLVKQVYANFVKPTNKKELEDTLDKIYDEQEALEDEIKKDVLGSDYEEIEATTEQKKEMINHEKAQSYLAYIVLENYLDVISEVFDDNKETAQEYLVYVENLSKEFIANDEDDEKDQIKVTPSAANKSNTERLIKDAQKDIDAMTDEVVTPEEPTTPEQPDQPEE
ncbi:lipoprotein [Spiroplasma alleghenense]|uniref:Lipoprotein n=1 Tax=Spiroplasma alleghenense TaxID=216931 RepID=A0A345Z521_9MOLU|nr:lipoprotein [Spiroplasma alleghenense]AXK51700.1 hypothetical protein SALLE_v1c10300 [Spiroplasma alleghenense]